MSELSAEQVEEVIARLKENHPDPPEEEEAYIEIMRILKENLSLSQAQRVLSGLLFNITDTAIRGKEFQIKEILNNKRSKDSISEKYIKK